MKLSPILSAAIVMALANSASAQVQRCVDSDGRVTFTDNVCPKSSVKEKSVKTNQKYVGSEKVQETNWAAQNEAFNKRHAERERRADNERLIHNFITTPLPPGVKYQRLTTYSDRPSKLDNR
ncbi:DUF4124 domain-containing protein [Undibacterium sp. Ji42W]|uniref:DUF4124 domain-containing protein n=1 Tax=Undibacterium sp. Ji42W TaxID=3413039 RepID=UPI003BF178B9